MPGDFVGVLEAIKRMGYDEVEFAGYHERDPRVVGKVLADIGLTSPSAHLPLADFRNDFEGLIERAEAVGHDYVILPWLTEDERPTSLDGYRRLAEELNGWGEQAQAAGMQMTYHNHEFEFDTFGGETPGYDALLDATDSDLVDFELDLYWVTHAGYDPLDYFDRYPGRFPLWHVKDRAPDGAMVPVGSGTMDFVAIFDRADQAGLQHAFVEHDHPGEAMNASLDTLRAGYAHLDSLR